MKIAISHYRAAALLAVLAVLAGTPAGAAEPSKSPESTDSRQPVATVASGVGVLARTAPGKPFERVLTKQQVHTGDLLVCPPGIRTGLQTRSRAVLLTLWGNLPQLSDSPVLESSVILHENPTYDLDLTLVKGRVLLTNTREKGPARIWVRGKAAGALLTLWLPGDLVALEMFGRWPAGVPFSLKHSPTVAPTQFWEVHVLRGRLDITAGKSTFALSAPPGPAYFRGDSVAGPDPTGPRRRNHVPEWADPKIPEPATADLIKDFVDAYRKHLVGKGAKEATEELLAMAHRDGNLKRAAAARAMVVLARASIDDIPAVLRHLEDPKYPEMRRAAVIALRHWIGSAGRDEILYKALLKDHSPTEAETIMSLLHSPFDAEQPESYETLIAYLGHTRLAVRELAYWHLVRMAPSGREITYDPAGEPADRAKGSRRGGSSAFPAGSLPPEAKEKPKGSEPGMMSERNICLGGSIHAGWQRAKVGTGGKSCQRNTRMRPASG